MSIKFTVIKHLSSEQTTSSIGLLFEQYIDQDDISCIYQQIFETFAALTLIEKNIGADRECIRFEWKDTQFELNIECYSQSVWIEPQYHQNVASLNELFLYLSNA